MTLLQKILIQNQRSILMSPELALLYDLWDKVKPYVQKKEKLHVAEEIVRAFDDNVDLEDVEENINSFDTIMKTALVSHYDLGLESEEEDDEEDYWD